MLELVAEALERYWLARSPGSGLSKRSYTDAFTISTPLARPAAAGMDHGKWWAEHLHLMEDLEGPLLVEELCPARSGWARRFQMRGREEARRLEQEAFGAADNDDNSTLEKTSRSFLKELKRITDSNVRGEKFVKQLYQMLNKEKAKFAQHAAQFQKEAYCPNKCGVMMQYLTYCPECNSGIYLCWKSLDCGDRQMKVREKRNLTLNCLLKWHRFSVGLTDYQFFRDMENGGETLLYKGKNPILIIPSVTSDDTGLYRCELGTVSSGPATIIRYHVTVLSPNATEESTTTNLETGDETAPQVQAETAALQGETAPQVQAETAPLQGETAPQVQAETATLQGETAPQVQAETAPLQGETSPSQGDTASAVQGETGPPVQAETGPTVQGDTTSLVQGETTQTVQGEMVPPIQDEMASPVQGEMTPTQGETAPVQGETAPPGQVETASPQDETAPGQGETALLVGETAPLLGDMAPLEEASVRPNSADVETSSATVQPSQAESMLHGPLIGLLICSSVALIAALGVRIKKQGRACPTQISSPGLVSSQDAPSQLFLPGFLLPFPVPHPVLGAGTEASLYKSRGTGTKRQADRPRPSGCCGTCKGAMLSGERKEGGSPRFGKLHLPVGLWINSPRKQLAKLGRRWPSAASVKSSSSDTGSRSSEPLPPPPPHVELRRVGAVKAAGGASGSRAKRISQLFRGAGTGTTGSGGAGGTGTPGGAQRWASEKKLPELAAGVAPEPPLASRATAPPGVLKIFGAGLASGANYKSVLATARSTARELVAEALERYGLASSPGSGPGESSGVDAFALCDALGRQAVAGVGSGEWRAEHLRVLGDSERPLLVQELWRARPGWARRFELRGREEARRLEQEAFGAGDSDGTGAPSWRPQKNRSRAASGGAALASPSPGSGSGAPAGSGGKERSENLSLRRSVSELSLQGRRRRQQERRQQAVSMAPGAADTQIVPADPGDFDQLTQCLIQAPSNRPYFLLLQGYQDAQDFVVYVMTREQHVFGRGGTSSSRCGSPAPYVDTFLNAPDILPRHCTVRAGPEPPAMVRPARGAPVMHNGCLLLREAELHPGDLLGLGEHFLFMYKDPRTGGSGPARPPWLPARPGATPPGPGWAFSCRLCGRGLQERGEALAAYLDGREPVLRFRPREEEALLGEIVRAAASGAGELPPLGPATLLALCVQHSARELELGHLPRLLGRLARLIKEAVWEKIKEIGDRQPENHPEGVPEVPLTPEAVSVELRPLMLWMANTTELLSFVQEKVLEMEKEADQEDPQLCNDLELCDEAMALLDEVIMCTFQQSVYYLTKTLYSTLPALLDSNPFTAGAELPGPGADLGAMPPGLRPTLGVFQAALELTSQCELHPDLVSQTFGYLFFFSNASLLNSLMERGQGRPFYQWSRAVQIRTNLDLVLDWLQGAGLGDIATEFFRKLSIAVNLLCVPRTSLLKASWSSLRTDHSTLTPAQLHHLLSHYQLGPGRGPPPAWDPPPAERDAVDTGDIFESFSSHPPLILPLGSSRLRLTGPVTDDALHRELRRLRRLLWDLEQQELPANHRHGPPVATPP
ncbi:ras-interacting protein 1 isoform X2 [Sciurus carolinensis]|nr:ras-interacting protein 1 isoform X2 [Sciurus carolinensis]